jgi:CBS domain-containing protein
MDRPIPVSEILSRKGIDVLCGPEDLTIVEAARLMVEARVGALVVMDGGDRVVGILTERDVLRFTARHTDRLSATRVGDIMSRDVLVGLPTDTVDAMMALMTERRIRHLPILVNGRLAGIVSLGDLVKTVVHEATFEVRMLRDYITGSYPG